MIKKKIKYASILLLQLILFAGFAMTAYAQATRPPIIPKDAELPNDPLLIPRSPSGVAEETYFGGTFLPVLTTTVISAAGATAILFIIIGGIQILTAYGNDEKLGKGKKTITFAIIGLLIAILSYAIVSIISAINLNTPAK